MRFITKEHWAGWNSNDEKVQDWAHKSSTENFKAYSEQLEELRTRLNKRNWEFFKNGLHDGQLVSFNVGDRIDLDVQSERPLKLVDFNRTTASVRVMSSWFDAVYDLKYEKVSKAVFDFPSDSLLFHDNKIGDWGYDELSSVSDTVLRHEVLFSSGTVLLIDFERFSYKKTSYKGSRY